MNYQELLNRSGQEDKNIVCVYPYGSRVYGNFHKSSDYDFIVVVRKKHTEQFSDNLININYYTVEEHQKRLDDHEISAIECQFLQFPKHEYIERQLFKFNLDKSKLRHSLSAKSSNSWVKCKKKLTVEKDYDLSVGRKSMFHAFRIIDFGIQLATHGKITNYDSCNGLYKEIMSYFVWNDLFDEFKTRYNNLLSKFRKVAEK